MIGIIATLAINGTGRESQQVSDSSAVNGIGSKTLHISGTSALTLGYGNKAAVRDLIPELPLMRNSGASNSAVTFSRSAVCQQSVSSSLSAACCVQQAFVGGCSFSRSAVRQQQSVGGLLCPAGICGRLFVHWLLLLSR